MDFYSQLEYSKLCGKILLKEKILSMEVISYTVCTVNVT